MVINEDYKIESDNFQVNLFKRSISAPSIEFPQGKETWKITHHPDVTAAFKWLIKQEINDTELKDLQDIRDCIQDLYRLYSTIKVVVLEKIVHKVKSESIEDSQDQDL